MSARTALQAQATALRVQADALDALAAVVPDVQQDELLGVDECRQLGVGREALRGAARRGELAISQGPRGKLLVRRSALEAWLASKPYSPANEPVADLSTWDKQMQRVKRAPAFRKGAAA